MAATMFVVIIIVFVLLPNLHAVPINEVANDMSYRYQMSFDNRTVLITTVFEEPFMMLKKTDNGTRSEGSITRGTILDPWMVEGYCADLAYLICHEKLRIPYKFIIETKYGSEIERGVWIGMIGALVNRQADLAIASLTITSMRAKVVDFSQPFINSGISIMIHKPERMKPGLFFFMAPLSIEIWIGIIVSYVLVSIILFFINRFLPSSEWDVKRKNDVIPRDKFSVHNTLLFSFVGYMQQDTPHSISGRIVTGVWWFFSLILFSIYISNLAAFSNVERMVPLIESIEDLAKQTQIRYGVVRGGSTMAFFNNSDVSIFKTTWNFMQKHKEKVFVASNQEGIEKVRRSKGRFVFILETTLNEYTNERFPCDTMRIGGNIQAKDFGIATPHGSDLREAINIALLELTEMGFLQTLKQKWYYEQSECRHIPTKDSKQIGTFNLVNMAGIFYILIIGLAFAIVIAFIEFFLKSKRDSTIRLTQNISKGMDRNLRRSSMDIDLDETKESLNYLPLQQQPTMPTMNKSPNSND